MQIVPSVDLLEGNVVRLKQGKRDQVSVYDIEPLRWVKEIVNAGFSLIHVVDLDGALKGERTHDKLIAEMVDKVGVRVQTGGGVRNPKTVAGLFQQGVERAVIGTLFFALSHLPESVAAHQAKIVVALDVEQEEVKVRGWQESALVSLWEALRRVALFGFNRILLTDIVKDGMLSSPNIELYAKVKKKFPQLVLQASGGVSSTKDLAALAAVGVDEVIVGRALVEGKLTLRDLQFFHES